jgi:hypothetical protein
MLRVPLWVGIWSKNFSLAIFSAGAQQTQQLQHRQRVGYSIAQNGGRFGAPARRVRAPFFR